MRVLIVEHNIDLAKLWARFLMRQGADVQLAHSQEQALEVLRFEDFDALVLELVLPDGGAIAIADYAAYRLPNAPVITVTNSTFFSDSSIFELMPNARGIMRQPLNPSDLVAMLEHYQSRPLAALRA